MRGEARASAPTACSLACPSKRFGRWIGKGKHRLRSAERDSPVCHEPPCARLDEQGRVSSFRTMGRMEPSGSAMGEKHITVGWREENEQSSRRDEHRAKLAAGRKSRTTPETG